MSGEPIPTPPLRNVALDTSSFTSQQSSSLWDRLSAWASEHKAVVYTIAGVAVVVTGAGAVYYLSDSRRGARPAESSNGVEEEKTRQSKKDRRKAKKQAEEAKKEVTPERVAEPGTSNGMVATPSANHMSRGNCQKDADCGNRRRSSSHRRRYRWNFFRTGTDAVQVRPPLLTWSRNARITPQS